MIKGYFPADLTIPDYDGRAYEPVNGNIPWFDTSGLPDEEYELYYDLDDHGRCTMADAVIGPELMPKKKRTAIGIVKPTGWQKDRYPFVEGENLYNRCHLIAYGLTAENANEENLITGTRYMNTAGMNTFENMVIDYIRETGNPVRYRVTPVFLEEEKLCRGVIMEGWSVRDEGRDICFCVYAFNVQPGVIIDYKNGVSRQEN